MVREITEQDLVNKGVSGLPDVPGLTTEAMQKKFDEISRELLVPRFNEMAKEVNEVNESLTKLDNATKSAQYGSCHGVDLNTITTTGIYICGSGSGATLANNFPQETKGYLVVYANGPGQVIQVYHANKSYTHIRAYWDNKWGGWNSQAFRSELIPETKIAVTYASNVNSSSAQFDFRCGVNNRVASIYANFKLDNAIDPNVIKQVCTFEGGAPARGKMTVPLIVMNESSVPLGTGMMIVGNGVIYMIFNIAVVKGYIVQGSGTFVA